MIRTTTCINAVRRLRQSWQLLHPTTTTVLSSHSLVLTGSRGITGATQQRRRRNWASFMTTVTRPAVNKILPNQHPHHRHQRPLSSSSSSSSQGANEEDPYQILKIPRNSEHETVKAAFLELALKHHPDQNGGTSTHDEFVRLRQAFESITNVQNGTSISTSSMTTMYETEEEFQQWFHTETRRILSFDIPQNTINEIVHVYNNVSRGGIDRGGYFGMARQLSERQQQNSNGASSEPQPQLTERPATTIRRRKKKR